MRRATEKNMMCLKEKVLSNTWSSVSKGQRQGRQGQREDSTCMRMNQKKTTQKFRYSDSHQSERSSRLGYTYGSERFCAQVFAQKACFRLQSGQRKWEFLFSPAQVSRLQKSSIQILWLPRIQALSSIHGTSDGPSHVHRQQYDQTVVLSHTLVDV